MCYFHSTRIFFEKQINKLNIFSPFAFIFLSRMTDTTHYTLPSLKTWTHNYHKYLSSPTRGYPEIPQHQTHSLAKITRSQILENGTPAKKLNEIPSLQNAKIIQMQWFENKQANPNS